MARRKSAKSANGATLGFEQTLWQAAASRARRLSVPALSLRAHSTIEDREAFGGETLSCLI